MIWANSLDGACFGQRLIQWLVMWFRMKRVRSDLVDKKFGLMREKFMAASAALSTASLPLLLRTQIKVTENLLAKQ